MQVLCTPIFTAYYNRALYADTLYGALDVSIDVELKIAKASLSMVE